MGIYLAVDLGAESGRVIAGSVNEGKLVLEELHRFPNHPVRLPTGLYWNTLSLWHEILHGLTVAGRERKFHLNGIGVDTWAIDFGLLGADGALVDNPRHYRDPRNQGMVEAICARVPKERIFDATGIQFMPLNTLCQWYAMQLASAPALQTAQTLLLIPDLFNYFLTGVRKVELTNASTSQFCDPRRGAWALELIRSFGLNESILPEIVTPGTVLGPLLPYVAEQTGLDPATPVIATASHDTAAAVAAVPAHPGDDWCYISSGTWSLMGVELNEPCINARSLELNFTNEIGVEGRIRFLKNIAGLWLLQECRRAWALDGHEYSYEELTSMAAEAEPCTASIPPDAFLDPGRMPERIAEYCRQTGQTPPATVGSTCRVILESLALRYRQVLKSLESVTGRSISKIHIVGGGSRNQLLNQLVADATGRTVLAGPTEATAAGNVLVQALGSGELADLEAVRAVVRASFEVTCFEPGPSSGWNAAYKKFS